MQRDRREGVRVLVVASERTEARVRARLRGDPRFELVNESAAQSARAHAVVFEMASDARSTLAALTRVLTRTEAPVVLLADAADVTLAARGLHHGARELVLKDDASFDLLPRVVLHAIETRDLHDEMLQHARLSTVGRLAASLAHEIGNAVTSVSMNLEEIRDEVDTAVDTRAIRDRLDDCDLGIATVSALLSDLRALTRGEAKPGAYERLDLVAVVNGAVRLVRPQCRQTANLEWLPPAQPMWVRGQTRQLRQVVVNLMLNAVDAIPMGRRGTVTVTLACDGSFVELRIHDDGVGVPPDVQTQLFRPFVTTKSNGTGLGLSVVRELVEAHRGRVGCRSRPGDTVFDIRLPRAEAGFDANVEIDLKDVPSAPDDQPMDPTSQSEEAAEPSTTPSTKPSTTPSTPRPRSTSATRPATLAPESSAGVRRFASRASDVDVILTELRASLPSSPAAIVVFASPNLDLGRLGAEISRSYPNSVVTGCTTSGQIGSLGFQPEGVTALCLDGPFRVERFALDLASLADSIDDVTTRTRQLLARMPADQSAFGFLLVDGLSEVEEQLAAALYAGTGSLPIVGGSAGDDLEFRETRVLVDGEFRPRHAVLLVVQTTVPFTVVKVMHHVPTSRRMVITEADPSRRRVLEIDGRPAAQAYADYVSVPVSELGPHVFSKHPVMLRVGDQHYIRSIQRIEENDVIRFYCAIDTGVILALAEPSRVMESLREAFDTVQRNVGPLAVVLGCDCILRRLELEQLELANDVGTFFADRRVVGFSTYGEQIDGLHVNQTFTGIAIGGVS